MRAAEASSSAVMCLSGSLIDRGPASLLGRARGLDFWFRA